MILASTLPKRLAFWCSNAFKDFIGVGEFPTLASCADDGTDNPTDGIWNSKAGLFPVAFAFGLVCPFNTLSHLVPHFPQKLCEIGTKDPHLHSHFCGMWECCFDEKSKNNCALCENGREWWQRSGCVRIHHWSGRRCFTCCFSVVRSLERCARMRLWAGGEWSCSVRAIASNVNPGLDWGCNVPLWCLSPRGWTNRLKIVSTAWWWYFFEIGVDAGWCFLIA